MAGFAESIGKWAAKTTERMDAVYARSVELLAAEMTRTKPQGGFVPFLTGNLARSLLASKTAMPRTADGPFSGSNVGLVAATLTASETVWLGYQARYARRRNYGFLGADSLGRVYSEAGDYFVERAIAEWGGIVEKAVTEVKRQSSKRRRMRG